MDGPRYEVTSTLIKVIKEIDNLFRLMDQFENFLEGKEK